MRKKRKGSAAPIYAFALVWLLFALLFSLSKLSSLLICAGISAAVGFLVWNLVKSIRKKKESQEPTMQAAQEQVKATPVNQVPSAPQKETRFSPEVNAIIDDGKLAMKEMGRLYSSIKEPAIRSKINELMSVSDKIVRDAIDDPADVPQIRKFLDFYLPTTIKLLNAYDRMSAQEVEGENISGSMDRIEEMLDTTISAYKKQLDALFANQAADIQTDIDIMNGMLAREGLGGKSYLDLKDFMKQYEEQQKEMLKGSTSNG